jgi:hypothetical protein
VFNKKADSADFYRTDGSAVYNLGDVARELRTGVDGLMKTHADFPNENLPKKEQLKPDIIGQTLFNNFKIVGGINKLHYWHQFM